MPFLVYLDSSFAPFLVGGGGWFCDPDPVFVSFQGMHDPIRSVTANFNETAKNNIRATRHMLPRGLNILGGISYNKEGRF